MALIDDTYFIAELSLPVGKYSDLTTFINRLEPDFLVKVLGYELSKKVIDNDSLVSDLINGVEFVSDEKTMKWRGFVNDGKKSVIANYVYYFYLRSNATFTTNVGEKKANTENSQNAGQGMKVMRAWDEMLNELEIMEKYIKTVPELNDIYDPTDLGRVNAFDL